MIKNGLLKEGIGKSITGLLLVILSLAVNQVGAAQGESFTDSKAFQKAFPVEQVGQTSLTKVLENLKNHYGVTFIYEDRIIQGIYCSGNIQFETRIDRSLNKILAPLGFEYKKVNSGTYVITLDKSSKKTANQPVVSLSNSDNASKNPEPRANFTNYSSYEEESVNGIQIDVAVAVPTDIGISGKVFDEKGNPLPGASVTVKGTTRGTTTSANGDFTLDVPNRESVLSVTFIGYGSQEILVGNQSFVNVSMVPDDKTLNEIVVIGYGSREKKDLTGAISTISSKDIGKSVSQSPELAMQGRMAGVFVSTPGGSAFARPQVRIRGVSTFGYAEPLYVVDGIPLTEFGSGTDGADGSVVSDIRGNVNILSMINPNDIESMSVLKDASAAAIYGVRAANGVILITTKKGVKGTPKIDISVSNSFQSVPKRLDMLNVSQFTELYRSAYANNTDEAGNLPDVFKPESSSYLGGSQTYDWQERLINSNAKNNDYSLRISGGNDGTRYYVSGGYTNSEGSLVGNKMQRYSLAMNVDSKVSKYITTGVTYRLAYNDVTDQTPSDLTYAAETSPWQPIYDPNGINGYAHSVSMNFIPNPELGATLENFSRPQYLPSIPTQIIDGDVNLLWGPETNANGFGSMSLNESSYKLLRNMGTTFAQIEPIPGLKFKGTLSMDWVYNNRNSWGDVRSYLFSQTPANPFATGDGTSIGTYTERHSQNYNLIKEFSVNYSKVFQNKHHVDVLLNAMDQKYTYQFLQSNSSQTVFDQPGYRTINNVSPYSNAGSTRDINALQGYLGRLNYSYNNKYYLDATVRRDGASRFAPGYKWGTFPAISGAWRISQEPFMSKLTFIDDLKIRGGWGKLGNQETRSFAYLSLVANSPDYALGSGDGNAIGALRNGSALLDFPVENLTWEIGETSSFGVDGSFLGNRLSATVEYYNRLTSGILQAAALPASVGNQNSPILNIASVRNKGMEFQLGYNNKIGEISYSISGNLTTVDNEVVKTFRDQPFGGEYGRIEVGMPMNFLWGYKMGGVFQTQGEIDTWTAANEDATNANNFAPGDIYFNDVSGPDDKKDNIVSPDDRTYLGKTIPGFYYGLNLGANYRNFDLSIFFQGVGDVYRYNNWRASGERMSGAGNNQWSTVLGRWTESNNSTTMPRAVRSDPAGNNRFSDRFVENAAFFRLKNVQLGFSLPSKWTQSIGFVNGARLYVGGTNLFAITKWTGLDPEDSDRNGQLFPPVRSLTTGLTASF